MPRIHPSGRGKGVSLIEVILVVGLFSVIGIIITPFFLSISEERVLQEQASTVEKNAGDILHVLDYYVRHAERVKFPQSGSASGKVLMLQTENPALDPIVIGRTGTALQLVTRATSRPIHSDDVVMTSFSVRNASVSLRSQGVSITFTLQYAHSPFKDRPPYRRTYKAFFPIFPADTPKGDPCRCSVPTCQGSQEFNWKICTSLVCTPGPAIIIQC